MIFFPFNSLSSLIIVTPHELYFSTLKLSDKSYKLDVFKSYKTLTELFKSEDSIRDLIVILDDNSSLEDEIDIPEYLNDKTIIESALELEIKKKSTIHSEIIFHYLKRDNVSIKDKQRYSLFGFDRHSYNDLLQTVPNKNTLDLITTSKYLFFNYCQSFIFKPYIALYRFNNQDILIVSDGHYLLFSRSHFNDEIDLAATVQSLEYVLQRFKKYNFTIYVGGDFLSNTFKLQLETELNIAISTLEQSAYPLFLRGLKKLPKMYNFTPKSVLVKRWTFKLQNILVALTFFLFCISVATFFKSYSDYETTLNEYQNIQKEYKTQLRTLDLISNERLNQLEKIKKLESKENLKSLRALLYRVKPLSSQMNISNFEWKNGKKDLLDIVMKKDFKSLWEMDAFLLKSEIYIEELIKKFPHVFIEKDVNFKNFTLSIRLLSKKDNRHLFLNKKGFN